MADNVAITAGAGTTIASDDIGGVQYPRSKISLGADGSAVDAVAGAGNSSTAVMRVTIATDDVNLAAINTATAAGATAANQATANASLSVLDDWDDTDAAKVVSPFATVDVTATRMTDTTTYAANDAWANSDSAPTAGGYTLTSAARKSGGMGIITDVILSSTNDPALLLQGELWIFDSAPTAINDNAAFALSDADILKLVAVIPFTLADTGAATGANSFAVINGLNVGFTCVGTANLRMLVKVKNAYVPANAEVLTARFKIIQL